MGSLRNPIGPLPSSIYWRRRAVGLALLVLLALLITWAVNLGGDGGDGKSDNGKGPAPSITPGESPSGPAISERPRGRDETGDDGGGDTAGSGGEDGGTSDGGGGDGGADGGGGEDGGGGTRGATGGGAAGVGGGFEVGDDGVPAGSSMAACDDSAASIEIRSVKETYKAGETPKFELVAKNDAGSACKLAFGPEDAVITIEKSGDRFWSSKDCPWTQNPILLQVPADGQTSRNIEWDRSPSEPKCADPDAGKAKSGTFTAKVKAAGLPEDTVKFELKG
ncbi:hypothetical protein [Streptomyces boninensis]|uniref:hypothetical protein n=1 Tax=Streptomyces boninensis TaxID=2039455 RepID=UPI003B21DB14